MLVVGLQVRAALAEDHAVVLGFPRIRNKACGVLRSGFWFENGPPPGTRGVVQARAATASVSGEYIKASNILVLALR